MTINKQYVSKVNTYAGRNNPKYIVIHETDNYNTGSGAQRHAEAQSKGHLSGMSVHYYCGSDGIYQAAEHKDGTYSIGKEYGGEHSVKDASNLNSINIEICVNPDGNYDVARDKAIELVKHLISTTGIPAERVIRHFDAKGKHCPRKMMDDPELWEDFKLQITGRFIHDGLDYSVLFDPVYYSNRYADLRKAFGSDSLKLFKHFIKHGMKECRQPSEAFDVAFYKASYKDLQDAYGEDIQAYYRHYVKYGHKEGRKTIQTYLVQVGPMTGKAKVDVLVAELEKMGHEVKIL